jgi:hypothetical protein
MGNGLSRFIERGTISCLALKDQRSLREEQSIQGPYFSVFELVMQKADLFLFLYELPAFRFAKSKGIQWMAWCMFRCKDIQWMDLHGPPFDHVLDVGGDHRLFLGCPLSGYKDSMQGPSGLGGCLFVCFKGFWSLAAALGGHLFFAYAPLLREEYFRFPGMHVGGESAL